MRVGSLMRLAGVSILLGTAAPLLAQPLAPGAEIVGQSVQVTTNGVTNTVYFDPNGVARIVSPRGQTVNATWTASAGRLCLNTGGASECWPYTQAFQAGQAATLTSSCNVASTWLANSVNPPPRFERAGERG